MDSAFGLNQRELTALYRMAGIGTFAQLLIAMSMIVLPTMGLGPSDAQQYFELIRDRGLGVALLSSDLPSLIIVFPYLISFPALFIVLRKTGILWPGMALFMMVISVILCIANDPTFSLLHLGFSTLTQSDIQSEVASGAALLAGGFWHSTGGYVAGLFMQGAGVLICALLLKRGQLGRVMAIAGLVANGFDLMQHFLHPFLPQVVTPLLYVAGIGYLVWYPLLGWNFLKLSRQVEV